MPARLLFRDAHGRDVGVALPESDALLGRVAEGIVRSDDPTVSRQHARISYMAGAWFVEDLSTPNGTFVNEERALQRQLLRSGDVIRCGTLQVRFVELEHPPIDPTLAPPQVGAYRLLRLIGKGGMGMVFEAEHHYLGRRSAVKLLHADFAHQKLWVTRFFNEARLVNLIRHAGIVDVTDVGQLSDGRLFVIMELLEGQPLRSYLQATPRLSLPLALFFGYQLAAALQATHERGVVHRDLKPENVFLIKDPLLPEGLRTKLLDFGIAKAAAPGLGGLTEAGMLLGTPAYMSPEQCQGAPQVDGKADVYALGVMLYEMLAGAPPFVHPTPVALMTMHITTPPCALAEMDPSLPRMVTDFVERMLAKDPAARPTMAQVRSRLQHVIRGGTLPPPEA